MPQHRFKIGDNVSYSPAKFSIPAAARPYRILRRLPLEAGEYMYRIKSDAEQFERVARERELTKVSLATYQPAHNS